MANILIIEDDADIAAIERDYLSLAGYDVTIEPDGTRGLQAALTGSFDLLLLDLMLPGTDGFTICRPVREQKKLPILMVSARTGDADKIRGLGFGADDSIEKPFSPSVLVARLKVHLAQVERLQLSKQAENAITAGPLTAKLDARQIFKNGAELPLKNREYELLLFLMRHPGQVFSREQILSHVWGYDFFGDTRTVDTHIKRIRQKLPQEGVPWALKTVYGVGYKFEIEG